MKMINECENDMKRPKVLRERKLNMNLIIVSKTTGLLNIRDQIILPHKGIRLDRKKNFLMVRNVTMNGYQKRIEICSAEFEK